ncbi:MAG: hypothetical protein MAG451_02373 [Anaerolineales bacterium]|nr:hypothetical protein [Anaerolineales bacterium]
MRARHIILLTVLTLATACAAPAAPPGQKAVSTPTRANTRQEADDSSPSKLAKAMGEAAIVYERSGGLAGVSEQWTVYLDGRIVAGDSRVWRIAPEKVEQLLADIQTLGFFEMRGQYMSRDTCCDRFTYRIAVRSGDKANTVTTIDTAPDAPAALWETLDAIQGLIGDAKDAK